MDPKNKSLRNNQITNIKQYINTYVAHDGNSSSITDTRTDTQHKSSKATLKIKPNSRIMRPGTGLEYKRKTYTSNNNSSLDATQTLAAATNVETVVSDNQITQSLFDLDA